MEVKYIPSLKYLMSSKTTSKSSSLLQGRSSLSTPCELQSVKMSNEVARVFDGSELRNIDISSPFTDVIVIGAQVLDLADLRVSSSLLGITLPESLRCSAFKRIGIDDIASFRTMQLPVEEASQKYQEFITAIADELDDEPIALSFLDGNLLRVFLEDEDDFAMLAENLFTDLDIEESGKIGKSEIQNALDLMGVEMGIPPSSEYPIINEILRKHGAEGAELLGQAQFAKLLQLVLDDLADSLAAKPFVFIQNSKVFNKCDLGKLLGDEKQLEDVTEEIWQEKLVRKNEISDEELIQGFLVRKWGNTPEQHNRERSTSDLTENKDQFKKLVKEIIESQLDSSLPEANPLCCSDQSL